MHSHPQARVGKRVQVSDQGEIHCTGILGDDHTLVESVMQYELSIRSESMNGSTRMLDTADPIE